MSRKSTAGSREVQHLDAFRAHHKLGFIVARQGKHVIMARGAQRVIIPRNNPINTHTMSDTAQDAGLPTEEFLKPP